MGRPSKLTDEIRGKLVDASRIGMTRDLQAAYAGVSVSTLLRWIAAGRDGKPAYREFWEALKQAEAMGAANSLAVVHKASAGDKDKGVLPDWKAAAWFLERRHGYRKGGPAEASREAALEEIAGESKIQRLERRIRDVEAANRDALRSNSFQAYFAGVRLLGSLTEELELAKLQGSEDDGLDDMTSPAFLQAFETAAESWDDQLLEVAIGVYERRHGLRMLGVG